MWGSPPLYTLPWMQNMLKVNKFFTSFLYKQLKHEFSTVIATPLAGNSCEVQQ